MQMLRTLHASILVRVNNTEGLTFIDAKINRLSRPRDCLEIELVTRNFNEHESSVGIKTLYHLRRVSEVAAHQLTGISQNEVIDRVLGLKAFVNVFVPGKHNVQAISAKQRRQLRSKIEVRTVGAAI